MEQENQVTEAVAAERNNVEITLDCSGFVSYYQIQNDTGPIKRLYVKNTSGADIENLRVRISSQPDFLLPCTIEQSVLPRRTTAKFETTAKLSPLYMVAVDSDIEGEIAVEVLIGDEVVDKAVAKVTVTAFDKCNFGANPEALATFVKRTAQINTLITQVNNKLKDWKLAHCVGYNGNRNGVRNYFAACYSTLGDEHFDNVQPRAEDSEVIQSHKDLFSSKLATPLEMALVYASLIEANGQNAVICRSAGKWYVGVFLNDECSQDAVSDDVDALVKKAERGVNEFTMVCISDLFDGVAFERAEKNAVTALKRAYSVDFALDLKRARIMHVFPLPERVYGPKGYDLVQSSDFTTGVAPKQFKEYKGEISGQKEVNRVTQWERRLLDMDMRNALLNFKVSRTAVKLLVPSLEDFVGALTEVKSFTVDCRPTEGVQNIDKLGEGFERSSYLKPFVDYVAYEYKNKRFLTVYDQKNHDATLLRLIKKETSIQEETGTTTLYIAAGFLKWRENENGEDKFAPLLLYPVTLSKKGVAAPVYTVDVNTDDVRLNSTLLEFLYQEFNQDIRGLSEVALDSQQNILSVIARLKKEVVGRKGWEIYSNVFIASLSFANYQLWYDVKYKSDRFREHPIIRSLINNKLELPEGAFDLSSRSSDEAYTAEERMYLPISADSSQYSAIYDSLSKSFVLHGPPGTGKSQTITNIIANNIVRGRRVLFVAEKMAALSVVHNRLQQIGLGDFCLELHSNKTNKNVVLSQIVKTMSLTEQKETGEMDEKLSEINACVDKLQKELDAMHRKRYLGVSLYQAIMGYFENKDSRDCLHIDSMFYEKLVESTFRKYIEILTELALRAKECGDIEKSPFRHIGSFTFDEKWNEEGSAILEVFEQELRHLRQYARMLTPLFNMRTVALTTPKLKALYRICKSFDNEVVRKYFAAAAKGKKPHGIVDSYIEARAKTDNMIAEYASRYGVYPSGLNIGEIADAAKTGAFSRSMKKVTPAELDKKDRIAFAEFLLKCEQTRDVFERRAAELSEIFGVKSGDRVTLDSCADTIASLYENGKQLYAEFNDDVFDDSCASLTGYGNNSYTRFYMYAYESCARAEAAFCRVFNTGGYSGGNDLNSKIEYVGSLQKNFGFIPNWCKYQEMVEKCRKSGLDFVLEPLADGEISAMEVLSCFKKCVYYNFIRSELLLDDVLCQFSGLNLEEVAARFKELSEEYERQTRKLLYEKLVQNVPKPDAEGEHNLERVILLRAEKSNMKGTTLRGLFSKIPHILATCCPCMLMSPTSVTQFLDVDMDKFDLVIFDEASQLPTCKAVGCIARGNNVIVVGDPKQLPPTTFFNVDYKDDEHYEVEDLDSILDDCLALGMPENHLLWHYRSLHESLIAFSNAMYYGNTLLTFPSPNELNSKVSFRYVDGIYERGGLKCNKKEGDELVAEVIRRLKDPNERKYSIGIVTFNIAQQNYIENELTKKIHENGLDAEAYDREEPVFVKNLENVQGDERDLILFSVGYAPDKNGKLSLNFGPINQSGGYKRLNVAVTRARNEMVVFSGISGHMIDLSRTNSKGVEGLKAFLEYAERGREMLAINSKDIAERGCGIGEMLAKELKDRGIVCDYNLGVSDFKIDVAVVDPKNKNRYVLAILADSENSCKLRGVKDRVTMQTKILRKLGWNVYQLWTVNYYNNPRREIARIKDYVTALTQKKVLSKKVVKDVLAKYRAPYKSFTVKPLSKPGSDFVLDIANEDKIKERIRAIIDKESPIEQHYLMDKLTTMYNIPGTAKKAIAQLAEYVGAFDGFRKEVGGKAFYVDKPVETFRPSDEKIKRDITKIYPDEIIAAVKCAIESNVGMTRDSVVKEVVALFGYGKKTKAVADWIDRAIESALDEKQLMITVDGVITT